MHTTYTCPASFAQERFWLAQQLDPATPATLTWTFDISGPLDPKALRRALNELAARHEILRTTFRTAGGELLQVISEAAELPLLVQDGVCDARSWAEQGVRLPFDLVRGPLAEARLLRSAADRHRLQLRLHHIVGDALSVGLLLEELGVLYGGAALPAPPLQYADYAAWQRDPRRETRYERQLGFWQDRLGAADPPRLCHRRERAPGSVPAELPPGLVDELRAVAADHRASLYMCLLASFCAALRLDHVRLGAPVSDRPDPALAMVAGPFVNTLVLDVDARDDPTFAELLARARDAVLDAQANQDVPFERVVRRLKPDRQFSTAPLANTLFVLHSQGLPELRLPGLRVERVTTAPPPPPVDLVVSLVEDGGAVRGRFDYLAELCPPRTVTGLAADFGTVLRAAVQPGRRLSELLPGAVIHLPPPQAHAGPRLSGDAERAQEVCAIWAEVIGLDEVRPDDDFFDIGGYSLLAVEILARVEERYGLTLTVRQLFENPTPAELSGLL